MGRHTWATSGGFVKVPLNKQSAVFSDVVSAGGHDWRVTSFLNDGDFVSVYLQLMTEAENVTAVFDAAVFTSSPPPGGSHSGLIRHRVLHVYNNPPVDDNLVLWGFPRFLHKSAISGGIHLSIMWAVMVIDDDGSGKPVSIADVPDPPLPTRKRATIAVPPSDLAGHLGRMLDTAASTDVSFVVDDCHGGQVSSPVRAHRALLAARSPVFEAALCGHMLEADARSSAPITVRDMDPDTFKAMIRFVYTDDLPAGVDDDEEIRSLLAAADRYALDCLKLLCANRLLDKVSVGTVAGVLECADTYNCPELKAKCIDYMVEDENFKKVALTDGFLELMARSPSILSEVRERLGS